MLLLFAAQHVLTMYAGAVAVPLIVGSAIGLTVGEIAALIAACLLVSGVATLIQCLGVAGFGARLPVIMGSTFVSVAPSIAIAGQPGGLPAVFGAAIAAGLVSLLLIPLFGRISSILTPVVVGSAITIIGLSLTSVAVDWAAGGNGAADYGSAPNLLIAAASLAGVLGVVRFGRGFVRNLAIVIGILAGCIVAAAFGKLDISSVAGASWLSLPVPFRFGMPTFSPAAIATMTLVMLVTFVESGGMLIQLGRIIGRPLTATDLTRGLRADAAGAIIGGVFNSFPTTSFSQNLALVSMTGVSSRHVGAAAGGILIVASLLPKLATLIASIPPSAIGGAAIVLFGMVAASGIRTLGSVDYDGHSANATIVAVSLMLGMVPLVGGELLKHAPAAIAPFTNSGMFLGISAAVLLQLFFSPRRSGPVARPVDDLPA
jgi:NCS2 family nucleobase:cation symporter-2